MFLYHTKPVVALEHFRVVKHGHPASLSIQTHFDETNIFHLKSQGDLLETVVYESMEI